MGEALQPFIPDTTDPRMELTLKDAGWAVDAEGKRGDGAGNVMRLIAFVSDVYLSE
jgi:hypothetical protein